MARGAGKAQVRSSNRTVYSLDYKKCTVQFTVGECGIEQLRIDGIYLVTISMEQLTATINSQYNFSRRYDPAATVVCAAADGSKTRRPNPV